MNSIEIDYIKPLETAWGRMKDLLFRPFDISRWLVIGFCAWLATLGENGGGGTGGNFPADHRAGGLKEIDAFIHHHLMLIISIATGVVVILVIVGLVVTWLSSRGKFMFLDNALTGRAEIVEPWRRWRKQGNSLFLWRIAYGFIMLGVLAVIGVGCLGLAWPDIGHAFGGRAILAIVVGFFLLLPAGLVAGYIKVFLDDFVVPLMRKHDLQTNAAWRLFLPLLRAQLGPFLLYGVIRFVVSMMVGFALVCACCLTCCCLFCICAIPYIGTVLLLPLFVWELLGCGIYAPIRAGLRCVGVGAAGCDAGLFRRTVTRAASAALARASVIRRRGVADEIFDHHAQL